MNLYDVIIHSVGWDLISWSRCWNRANKDKDIYLESVPGRGRGRGRGEIGLREELICDAGLTKPQPIQWGDSGAITTMSVPLWAEVAGSLHPEGPLYPCLTQSLGTVFPCVEYGLREGSSQQLKLPVVHSSQCKNLLCKFNILNAWEFWYFWSRKQTKELVSRGAGIQTQSFWLQSLCS